MAVRFISPPSLLRSQNPKLLSHSFSIKPPFFSFSVSLSAKPHKSLRLSSLVSFASSQPDPIPDPDEDSKDISSAPQASVTDEWGERSDAGLEPEPTKLADSDPPKDEDEWEEQYVDMGNGTPAQGSITGESVESVDDTVWHLKRCLVDTVYGTELGFRAGLEVRAEVLELVNQLEVRNRTPAPVETPQLLDGKWVLLYTAFSELLPLLAAGSIPLLKVESISQAIDSSNLTIVNSITFSSPFATFSFSASAAFEVRSPTRVQVEFKEGTLDPPEIKPTVDLPEDVDVFGQKISLSPVQQSLRPVQDVVANISRAISGQPPLKLPIPGSQTKSWLLITYLDEDLRISRGDGGLFVLVKEGSPLLSQ
ncbi:hypothetical protein SLE2022_091550 [Rubroshorea leprosula]